MSEQRIIAVKSDYAELDDFFELTPVKKVFLVCDRSIQCLDIGTYFENIEKRKNIQIVRFDGFQPNPQYESVVEGVRLFRSEKCDAIVAVGGGSTIDVAKCIKLYSNMDPARNYLEQVIIPNEVKLVAVPTTAGTGSEATRYAVIYYHGEKQSVSDYSCIPSTVFMDSSVLKTLPEYQKKSTMMDAFCHAIEAFWSVKSTKESKWYSQKAIRMILKNKDMYLQNDEAGYSNMLKAANMAGKAINISQTTAGHAMCYKLTSLYGIAHGHAAALCVLKLWPYMLANTERCIDPRGREYLDSVFVEIAYAMNCKSADAAVKLYEEIYISLKLNNPKPNAGDFEILRNSVNSVRLRNNPVDLSDETINILYHQILL